MRSFAQEILSSDGEKDFWTMSTWAGWITYKNLKRFGKDLHSLNPTLNPESETLTTSTVLDGFQDLRTGL